MPPANMIVELHSHMVLKHLRLILSAMTGYISALRPLNQSQGP